MSAVDTTDRVAEIREAAARIFHEKGYDRTSIQDIAEAVGMLKGSLYHHIDSKEELLFDVIAEAHAEAVREAQVWQQADGPLLDRLRLAIETHVATNITHALDVGVFFHDFRKLPPERREAIARDRAAYAAALRALVEEGQATGELTAHLDPGLTVLAILGMLNWVQQWFDADGPATAEDVARSFASLVLDGLAERQGSAA